MRDSECPINDVLNNKTKMFESQHVYAARALSQILESIPIRYARTGNEYIFLLCLFLLPLAGSQTSF